VAVYDATLHQVVYEAGGVLEKLWGMEQTLIHLSELGMVTVEIGSTAPVDTTKIWLDSTASPAAPSTAKAYDYTTSSWVTMTEPYLLRHIGGQVYTNSATAPTNPVPGDEWFKQDSDTLYKRVTDSGGSDRWLDISTPGGGTVSTAPYGL